MIVIIGGVSGTGKSTIGGLLAKALDIPFYDGDDFHPESNIEKMKSGAPLDDADRQPWLDILAVNLAIWANQDGAVLACSALKEKYRKILSSKCNESFIWVTLIGPEKLLLERLNARTGHFMKPALLRSQLGTQELPDYGWVISVQPDPEDIVDSLLERLPKV